MITRKAYGGAYDVMSSKHIGARLQLRLADGGGGGDGPGRRGQHRLSQGARERADDPEARRAELVEEYREQFANPFTAAERGYVDDVIAAAPHPAGAHHGAGAPAGKRGRPAARKHGNIPL